MHRMPGPNERLAPLYPAHIATVKERHDRALAEHGFDHVVIFAGAPHTQFLDDMDYPFKVNPHFKAWVPVVDNAHCFLVYTPGKKPRVIFHQPVDYWHKPAETPSGFWVGEVEILMIATPEEARQHIPGGGRIAFIGEHDKAFEPWGFSETNPKGLLDRLHYERAWKTEYEVECMRLANEQGVRGHRAAEQAFREGLSEYEIHIAYLHASQQTEHELPYGNIIALNDHAAVLHYYHHDRHRLPEAERHSFLIDAGGSHNGYASDITRTYSQRTDDFQRLIDAMETMQQQLVAEVKPGVDYIAIHLMAHRKVAEIIRDFGLVEGLDADGIIERRISSTFLPHGVGHFIGLQVHDVGGFMADPRGALIDRPAGHPYLRLTRIIEEGQSFTIEPGLYFIESLLAELQASENARYVNWTRVDEFRKFGGIRIEDDVFVTSHGAENLTRNAFAAR
jgi:Xaa-Pro dipeptidase